MAKKKSTMTTMCPLNKVMLQRGELVKIKNQTMCPMMLQGGKLLKIKRNQCPMMMISAGSLSMQGRNAKVKRRS